MGSTLSEKPSILKAKSVSVAPDEFLTTQELMYLLKIGHKQTIYHLIDKGLPVIVVGKSYRFIKNEVVEFLRQTPRNRRSKRKK